MLFLVSIIIYVAPLGHTSKSNICTRHFDYATLKYGVGSEDGYIDENWSRGVFSDQNFCGDYSQDVCLAEFEDGFGRRVRVGFSSDAATCRDDLVNLELVRAYR